MGEAAMTIGIVGGGQLGRMLTLAAKPLGFSVTVLDSSKDCPAGQVGADVIVGGLYDPKALRKLASVSDVITVEIEHLDTNTLSHIAKSKPVYPAPETIRIIQDKYQQKSFLQKNNIPVAPFMEVVDKASAREAYFTFGKRMLLKTKHGAFDGRGNYNVHSETDLDHALHATKDSQVYAEAYMPFTKELSVIVAKDTNGVIVTYPVVEMRHERNICVEVHAPADISATVERRARALARKVIAHLDGAGVFAVELFLLKDGHVLVNEIAPRVHNSGHFTIEGCVTSQFEQHIRAITGLPLGDTTLRQPTVMVNLLGTRNSSKIPLFKAALAIKDTHVHWYGKTPTKIDRKMGHITVLGSSVSQATKTARRARRLISI